MHDRTRPDPCDAATGTVYVAFFKLIEGTFIDQRDDPAMYEALGAKTDDTDKTKDNCAAGSKTGSRLRCWF